MKITPSLVLSALSLGATLGLGACNETVGGPLAPTTSAATGAGTFRLSSDSPCAGEIERYQAIIKSDLDTGNLERKVYDQIESELSRAAAACAKGNGSQSHAIVAASKARHGYRA